MKRFSLILAVVLISASSVFAQNYGQPHFPFRVKIDNLEFKFLDVTGLTQDAPIQKSSSNSVVNNLPGSKRYGNVTLKRGMTSNTKEMNDFFNKIKKGANKKTTITIEMVDEQGNVSMTWILANGYPVKATSTVDGRNISIDDMALAHAGVTSKEGNKK